MVQLGSVVHRAEDLKVTCPVLASPIGFHLELEIQWLMVDNLVDSLILAPCVFPVFLLRMRGSHTSKTQTNHGIALVHRNL